MKYQADKCNEQELRAQFRVTPERLKARIDTYFKADKKSETAQPRKKIGKETLDAINYVLGFIHSRPAFTQDDLLDELVLVLKRNTITFDEQSLRAQGNRIALCVLILLHNKEFDFDGHKKGHCQISSEQGALRIH